MEKKYIEVNKKAYNEFAIQHLNRHRKIGKYDLTDEDWVKLLGEELINKKLNNNVLEIGPGTGRILKLLEEKLKELVEKCKFKIIYKTYTEEPDRNKKWLTYIIKK